MAYSHVPIDLASPHGAELKNTLAVMQQARRMWREVREKMATMNDDTDWSHMEQQYGLPANTGGGVFYQIDMCYGHLFLTTDTTPVKDVVAAMDQALNQIG